MFLGGRRAGARPLLSELYAELNLSMSSFIVNLHLF